MSNEAQIEFWNAAGGERWAAFQERLDLAIRPIGLAAIEAAGLAPGEAALDVGCGCGDTVLELARRVGADGEGTGRVVGLDVSAPMLARAEARALEAFGRRARVELTRGDASCHPLPVEGFDVLFSRFGVMFFDEPAPAFAHLARSLKRGGRAAFVCWRAYEDNPWARVPREAAAPVAPPTPPEPRAPGPFRFAEGDWLESLLTQAGLAEVKLTRVDVPMFLGASLDDAVQMATQAGPVARQLAEVDDAARARAVALVRDALAPHVAADGHVELGTSSWLVTARR
jgi:SAM-dependent methyltransferase